MRSMFGTSTPAECKKRRSIPYRYSGSFWVGLTMTPGISKCSASVSVSLIHDSMTRAFSTLPVFLICMMSDTRFSKALLSPCSFWPIQFARADINAVFLAKPVSGLMPVRPSPVASCFMLVATCLLLVDYPRERLIVFWILWWPSSA